MSSRVRNSGDHTDEVKPPPGLRAQLQLMSFGKLNPFQRQHILKQTGCTIDWRQLKDDSSEMLTISGPQHNLQAAYELVIQKNYENKMKSAEERHATDDQKSAWSAKSAKPPRFPEPPQTLSAHLPVWPMPWPPGFGDQFYNNEQWRSWYQFQLLNHSMETLQQQWLQYFEDHCRDKEEAKKW